MASDKKYSAEFKAQVAREALDQSNENVHSLAQNYDVPVSVILTWSTQLENKGPAAFQPEQVEEPEAGDKQPVADQEEVDVEITNPEITDSIGFGVMKDKLNYRRLVFWSVLGTVLFVIFVQALVEMFQYNAQVTRERVSGSSEYYDVRELKEQAEETLNSFGVVDIDNGIYRIPLDSAINEIAEANE